MQFHTTYVLAPKVFREHMTHEFIAVFYCIDLVGVLCVCVVNTIYIVMYISISLCKHFVEYDMINVLIGDIQNKSQWASC